MMSRCLILYFTGYYEALDTNAYIKDGLHLFSPMTATGSINEGFSGAAQSLFLNMPSGNTLAMGNPAILQRFNQASPNHLLAQQWGQDMLARLGRMPTGVQNAYGAEGAQDPTSTGDMGAIMAKISRYTNA